MCDLLYLPSRPRHKCLLPPREEGLGGFLARGSCDGLMCLLMSCPSRSPPLVLRLPSTAFHPFRSSPPVLRLSSISFTGSPPPTSIRLIFLFYLFPRLTQRPSSISFSASNSPPRSSPLLRSHASNHLAPHICSAALRPPSSPAPVIGL